MATPSTLTAGQLETLVQLVASANVHGFFDTTAAHQARVKELVEKGMIAYVSMRRDDERRPAFGPPHQLTRGGRTIAAAHLGTIAAERAKLARRAHREVELRRSQLLRAEAELELLQAPFGNPYLSMRPDSHDHEPAVAWEEVVS